MTEKAKHTELGKAGEAMALEHLAGIGLRVVEINWRAGRLEIDIICENEKEVVFVEVKTRNSDYLADPFEAVNRSKQRRLATAADHYMRSTGSDKSFRFDIVSVVINERVRKLEHIEDAFYPTA